MNWKKKQDVKKAGYQHSKNQSPCYVPVKRNISNDILKKKKKLTVAWQRHQTGYITHTKTNHNMYLLNKVEANRSIPKDKYETVLKSFYYYYDKGKKGE